MRLFQWLKNYFYHSKTKKILKISGTNNHVDYNPEDEKFLKLLEIKGNNNQIKIHKMDGASLGHLVLVIEGNNCKIEIKENLFVGTNLTIRLGSSHQFMGAISNAHCEIGKNVRIEEMCACTYNSNNTISIGDNCLISLKVYLYNTDVHPIYDKSTGKLVNYVKDLIIGPNCWLGWNCSILKGVSLPEGTIVGWGAVVTKSIDTSFCAIAGNPAKIVKRNLVWTTGPDTKYQQNDWGDAK